MGFGDGDLSGIQHPVQRGAQSPPKGPGMGER